MHAATSRCFWQRSQCARQRFVAAGGIINSSGSSPDALVDALIAVNPVLVAPTVVKRLVSLLVKRHSYMMRRGGALDADGAVSALGFVHRAAFILGGAGASLGLVDGERGEESQRDFLDLLL